MKTCFKCLIIYGLFLLLLACGDSADANAVKKVYENYHNALREENIDALKDFIAAERRKEMLGEGAAMKLKLIKELLPTDIIVTDSTVSGAEATLNVEGKQYGQKVTGTVTFVKESGQWKLSKEAWSMALDTDTGTPGAGTAVQPFMDDPKKPPQPYLILSGHQGEISGLAFTPDGQYLISGSYGDYSLRMWDTVTGEEVSKVTTKNRVRGLALAPDGRSVFSADAYNYIIRWPLESGTFGSPETLVKNAGDTLALSPDGKYVVATGFKSPLRLWKLADGSLEEELTGDVNFRTLVFSASGKWLACGSPGNQYHLWDTKKWKRKTYRINKVSANSDVSSIDISPDDKYMATGHMDSSIVILDLKEREELHNFYVPDAATWDVKFSRDSKYLATAQQDKAVYVWEVETSRRFATLRKHSGAVRCLAFSPDGTTLASGGEDRKIVLWRSGKPPVLPGSGMAAPSAAKTIKPGAPEMMEVDGHRNLLKNPYANQDTSFWEIKGDVSIEPDVEDNSHFVIRYSGMFWQEVSIPGAHGRWALLIAHSSSERINDEGDDDQTGLPYLYGYMLNSKDTNRIDAYLNGQQMLHSLREPDEWGVIWGVFQVPEGTGAIRFFMQQADGRTAQNGSAARFDDPGIYLFDTQEEAKEFAKKY
jgi:WD40 repeat protein